MTHHSYFFLLPAFPVVILFLISAIPPRAEAQTGGKKLIYYGWGMPDTTYVRDHWSEMERMPFDGTGIQRRF